MQTPLQCSRWRRRPCQPDSPAGRCRWYGPTPRRLGSFARTVERLREAAAIAPVEGRTSNQLHRSCAELQRPFTLPRPLPPVRLRRPPSPPLSACAKRRQHRRETANTPFIQLAANRPSPDFGGGTTGRGLGRRHNVKSSTSAHIGRMRNNPPSGTAAAHLLLFPGCQRG